MPRAPKTGSLADAFATPAAKHRYTRRLFATIADRYDLITRVLSFGRDQSWKRRLMTYGGVRPGMRVLDLACGTGDLALLAAGAGGSVVGLDFTARMIHLARAKAGGGAIQWLVGDMGALPVGRASIDVVTVGYGLRNVPDLAAALTESRQVLKPGGVLCALDFDRPEGTWTRTVYLTYLTIVGSVVGLLLHGDPDTYRYIPVSIGRYPGARRVAALMTSAGFSDVRHYPVFAGFMAIHVARKGQEAD